MHSNNQRDMTLAELCLILLIIAAARFTSQSVPAQQKKVELKA